MNDLLIYTLIGVLFGILVLWTTCWYMVNKKKMAVFLPFYFVGAALLFGAGLSFYGLYLNLIWLGMEAVYVSLIIWIAKTFVGVNYAVGR
jgi:ABC-type antimicrobial peptide transport system permease subunit